MTSYCRTPLTFSAHQKPTVGDSKFSAVTNDHMGWMLCDGRLLSVTQYQFLFNVIGYSFGGSGTQFRIPNAAGRVPGAIGTGSDQNNSTFTALLGLSTGEYMHQLTIAEMPAHNHGVAAGGQGPTNNSTSINFTGLTVVSTQTAVFDTGHTHGYRQTNEGNVNAAVSLTTNDVNAGAFNGTTNSGTANLSNPPHNHSVNDPGHAHTLNSAGSNWNHNLVQPTLFMGNMFIYNGLVNYPSFFSGYPYTIGQNIY